MTEFNIIFLKTAQTIQTVGQADGLAEHQLKIITDEASYQAGVLDFENYARILAKIIENSYPQFTIGIFGGWGTGKTTLMNLIMYSLQQNKKILTVWFDAWRYEREEHLAVIPFIRTIDASLQNFTTTSDPREFSRWSRLHDGLERTLKAFVKSTKLTYGVPGVISAETNLKDLTDPLKAADGVYLHSTDFLKHALDDIRKGLNGDAAYRIVVFVDDLDRCTPQNGLEVLESIKSFFDIEGIIYVIGMNHKTIDFLVKKKYESDPSITGFDYMKKIVQLPFHIPDWYESDIQTFVRYTIINQLREADNLRQGFIDNIEILISSIESNPREVKRFINAVIFAKAAFGNLPTNNLIIIQALRFRGEWNKFLDFLSNNTHKRDFFSKYDRLIRTRNDAMSVIEGLSNTLEEIYTRIRERSQFEGTGEFDDLRRRAGFMDYYSAANDLLATYSDIEMDFPKFLLIRNPLNRFLVAHSNSNGRQVKDILSEIDNMEEYRRALHASNLQF